MEHSNRLIEEHLIKGLFAKIGHVLGKPAWDGAVSRGW